MGGYTNKEDGEYDKWIKGLLGKQNYMLLKLEANLGHKADDKLTRIVIKQKRNELQHN